MDRKRFYIALSVAELAVVAVGCYVAVTGTTEVITTFAAVFLALIVISRQVAKKKGIPSMREIERTQRENLMQSALGIGIVLCFWAARTKHMAFIVGAFLLALVAKAIEYKKIVEYMETNGKKKVGKHGATGIKKR